MREATLPKDTVILNSLQASTSAWAGKGVGKSGWCLVLVCSDEVVLRMSTPQVWEHCCTSGLLQYWDGWGRHCGWGRSHGASSGGADALALDTSTSPVSKLSKEPPWLAWRAWMSDPRCVGSVA